MAAWHTPESVRQEWQDAPRGAVLDDLLEYAKEAVWAYAGDGSTTIPADVPMRFRLGQRLQAQAVWQLARSGGSDGSVGLDGYQARLYVLGYDIKRVLRPEVAGEQVG